jgi:hypothetical protein
VKSVQELIEFLESAIAEAEGDQVDLVQSGNLGLLGSRTRLCPGVAGMIVGHYENHSHTVVRCPKKALLHAVTLLRAGSSASTDVAAA